MTIDTATLALIQQIQTPLLTPFSKFIATITDPLAIILISLTIALFLYLKKQKTKAIFFASTIIITATIIKILKEIIQRPRPTNTLTHQYTNTLTAGFSFPSGHTTIALVFFGLITFLFVNKKHKITATITTTLIVALIAFTRLYLNVHWLTDIIGAIIIGIIILTISILTFKKPS